MQRVDDVEQEDIRRVVGHAAVDILGADCFGLIIDQVGEVLRLSADSFEHNPSNLDPRWAQVSAGVQRLDGQLMVVLDVNKVLASVEAAAA